MAVEILDRKEPSNKAAIGWIDNSVERIIAFNKAHLKQVLLKPT